VVKDAMKTAHLYRDALGFEIVGSEELPDRGVRVWFLRCGDTRIELLEEIREDSEISGFLKKRGEGFHHIAISVDDLDRALAKAKEGGVRVLPSNGKRGAGSKRVAFLHPKDLNDVLFELVAEGEQDDEG
jgi:methylmalonyl-CoA/ethylmalonyl-CoA epimerase